MSSAAMPYLELFYVILYMILFTFPPIIITAINDFDVPKSVAACTPELYTPGEQRSHLTSHPSPCLTLPTSPSLHARHTPRPLHSLKVLHVDL